MRMPNSQIIIKPTTEIRPPQRGATQDGLANLDRTPEWHQPTRETIGVILGQPLAWVPTAIIFWPTTELSIAFVIFLGAFFTVVLNVLGGARNIDERHLRAAASFGSRRTDIFWKIVLPATLPSIFTGMAVGMGITWEVVVAAEMIAGKSGLGYFTWASYVGGNYPQIIVGMISIGLAGYLSSGLIRLLGKVATPWQRQF